MTKRIMYKAITGEIIQIVPAKAARAQLVKDDGVYRIRPEILIYSKAHPNGNREETEQEFAERMVELLVPQDAIKYSIIEESDIPQDRYFRNAWDDIEEDGKVKICRNKAEAHKMSCIRKLRNKKLDELDKEQMKLLSLNADMTELNNKKQILRDLPSNIDLSIGSLDDLKAYMPEELSNATGISNKEQTIIKENIK